MKRLRIILLTLLLAVAYGAAGQGYVIDSVCRGAERHYRIDGESGSVYTWVLTNPMGTAITLPETADTVTIIWNMIAGDYTLSALQTSIHGCDSLELGIIKVFETPLADAGENITRCAGGPVTLLNASASGYSNLLWSSNGDGIFDDANALNPTYTPGTEDITNGFIILTLKAFSINPCNAVVTDQMTITLYPLPTASISVEGNNNLCQGDSTVISFTLTGTAPWILTYTDGFVSTTVNNIYSSPYNLTIFPTYNCIYSVSALSDAHCAATPAILTGSVAVSMNSLPVIDFSTNRACEGDSTYFTLDGEHILATSYWLWDFGDGTFWSCNSPGCGSMPHVFPAAGDYIVTLNVMDTNGCKYRVSHPVNVRPLPFAFFSFTTPDCLNSTVYFTDLCTNPENQGYLQEWEWNFGDGSPVTTFTFPTTPNTSHIYTEQGTYQVSLKVTNSVGCQKTYSHNITVTYTPIADFNYDKNCENGETHFYDNSSHNGGGTIAGKLWDFGDPTSGINNQSTIDNPKHIYINSGYYTVTLIVTNFNGCSDTVQKQIYVSPAPVTEFSNSPGCLNTPTLFFADTTLFDLNAIATYSWEFGDGGTSNTRNTQHTYLATGTYSVTLTIQDTAGCYGSITRNVIITIPPVAHFTANTDNCVGQSVQFNDLSTSTDGYITQWIWDFGDGNTETINFPANPGVTHVYTQAGIYAVSITVSNSIGCSSSETKEIHITNGTQADFMYDGSCQGTPVTFTDITVGSSTIIITAWEWNFGDPTSGTGNTSTSQNPTHAFANPGIYVVKLTTWSNSGCSNSITKNIQILDKPAVDFTSQGSCKDTPLQFVPSAVIDMNAIATWFWQFGDGGTSTQTSPTHTYTSAGSYAAVLTVTDTAGCTNTISHLINIVPSPLVNFAYTSPGCSQSAVTFTDFTSVPSGFITRWTWNFGDGSSQIISFPNTGTITHTYAQAGNYAVTLTVNTSDSCSNSASKTIIISPKPVAAFGFSGTCQGTAVSFFDQSGSFGASIASRFWNFGDPASGNSNTSTSANPSHSYSLAGTYVVELIVTTTLGCSDTTSQLITIAPPPFINFTSSAGCTGDTTQFNSSNYVNMSTTVNWLWNFGDGQTSTIPDPTHIYAQIGTYNVTLTITDSFGCQNTKSGSVTVIPAPSAAFSSSAPYCSGTSVQFTDLSANSSGAISQWHWTFGDGTDTTYSLVAPSISHVYNASGNYLVKLTVYSLNGCENTYQQLVTIAPTPLAAFNYQNTCEGFATHFTDQTIAVGGFNITSRLWNFGDPVTGINNTSTLTNPVHTFSAAGTYLVTLIATNTNGCSNSIQHTVVITPKPGVDFYHDQNTCLGNPVAFHVDTTATNTTTIQSYNWNFGDGTATSNLQNPVHTYLNSGTYNVTLTISDISGCGNSIVHPVTIGDSPVTAFSYTNSCSSSLTQFTDLSLAPNNESIVSWHWDFGVNNVLTDTSSLQNPTFTYTSPGIYTVTLISFTLSGCSNTKSQPVQVFTKPTAGFSYSASPCSNGSVQFRDSSFSYQATITSWLWEFEPFQYSTAQNPVYQYYAVDSSYNVKLMVTDSRGCVDSSTRLISVPAPLSIAIDIQKVCYGSPTQFEPILLTPSSDSLVSFNWNFGDPQSGSANTSTKKKPAHTFTSTGFFTITLTAIDKFGCTSTSIKSLEIMPLPVALISYETGQCDSTVTFTRSFADTSSLIRTYIWNYGDGRTDTLNAPFTSVTHKFPSNSQYTVTLTVIDVNGCFDQEVITIEHKSCLIAAFANSNPVGCQYNLISFTDKSACDGAITKWEWTWGDGSEPTVYYSYKPIVTHSYYQTGVYKVTLKVTTIVNDSPYTNSTSKDITINAAPVAEFSSNGACAGSRAYFQNSTNPNGTAIVEYLWDFGDLSTLNDSSVLRNPSYSYASAGEFNARLIVTNHLGCKDTISHPVTMFGAPSADFNYGIACLSHPTHFFDQSEPNQAPLLNSGWVFRNGTETIGYTSGMETSFVFDSLGIYNVIHSVSDTNSCTDTISYTITVVPSPYSVFNVNENFGNIQGKVQFENGSLGADDYLWRFGNGETSYETSPVVTFDEDGDYLIQLFAENNFGCIDSTGILYKMLFKGLWIPNSMVVGTVPSVRLWKPVGVNLSFYKADVYDRWGNLLWTSSKLTDKGAPAEGWDGTYNEILCQEGVYVWSIIAIFSDGTIWRNNDVGNHEGLTEGNKGTITLIR